MNSMPPKTLESTLTSMESVRERIARAFGRSASSYDAHADLQRAVGDRLLGYLPMPSNAQWVLDLGCGTGYCTAQLRRLLPTMSVVALDLAEPMLQYARTQTALLPVCADAHSLPLCSQSVDLVVSNLAIQWCSDYSALFAELSRVLRPGGIALLSTLGPDSLQELRDALTSAEASPQHNNFSTAADLQQFATAAKFKVEQHREVRIKYYDSLRALTLELKGLGATAVMHADRSLVSPAALRAADMEFARRRTAQGIPVQWEVYYLVLQRGVA